jgi:hypothetical protein
MTRQEIFDFLNHLPQKKLYFQLLGSDSKYFGAMKHIIENKPKFVLEYGGGKSTWVLTLLINELNYGGKIIGIENQEIWYNDHVKFGYNEFNNILLVKEYQLNEKKYTYIHDLEPYKDVDFVILDGPDLRAYGEHIGITDNLELLVNYQNKKIPYFIDGRGGTVVYYESIGYGDFEIKDEKIAIDTGK